MSYVATVAEIKELKKHPNADRIQLATVLGEQVIVGLDAKVGDVGIFFPVDGELSHEFCVSNNLYSKSAAEKLQTGATQWGFFDHNRRVRAQKFRGEKSEGFWIPLEGLREPFDPRSYGPVEAGMSFTSLNGYQVCRKHETKATRVAQTGNRRARRGETLLFPKHQDTDQFRHKWEEIPEGSIIYLTEKLHGTSGRYGHVLEDERDFERLPFWKRLLRHLASDYTSRWQYLLGSRNVILEHSTGKGFYGDDSFRYEPVKHLTLRKGEVIFYEQVGELPTGQLIMPTVEINAKELPEIAKQYGSQMTYRYCCPTGTSKIFVYRIVQMNEDGEGVELSWPQVKRRAAALGLETVPELENSRGRMPFLWSNTFKDAQKQIIEDLSHGPSLLDPTHIREGVAIRVETPDGKTYFLKEKSYEFKLLEGIVKSNDAYVDVEEAA